MLDPLDGSVRRLVRAIETQKRLERDIKSFLDSNPYEVIPKADDKRRKEAALFLVGRPTNPDWGVLIGECLHNLRAALDNAVWEMILRNPGGNPKDGVTGFPTKQRAPEWNTGNRRATSMISGVDQVSRALINWSQPFHARDRGAEPINHTLWVLNELWNIDKHRVLHTTATAVRVDRFEVVDHDPRDAIVDVAVNKGWRLNRDIEAGRIRYSAPPYGAVAVKFDGVGRVAFNEPPTDRLNVCGLSVTEVLAAIGNDVLDIVRNFQYIAGKQPRSRA